METSRSFVTGLLARLTGPMHFRLIVQPVVAIGLGIRDGLRDAKAGRKPFVLDLIVRPEGRARQLKRALASVGKGILIAIVLDAIIQYIMFKTVHPGAAIFVGIVLMAVPYSLARGLANRIATARMQRDAAGQRPRPEPKR